MPSKEENPENHSSHNNHLGWHGSVKGSEGKRKSACSLAEVSVSKIISMVYWHIAHAGWVSPLFSWMVSEIETRSGKGFARRGGSHDWHSMNEQMRHGTSLVQRPNTQKSRPYPPHLPSPLYSFKWTQKRKMPRILLETLGFPDLFDLVFSF